MRDWLGLFLSPRLFLAGFVAGLAACALLGREVERVGFYTDYVRIGGAYQFDNTFLVTPTQLTHWIESHCSRDKVLVLIGGSSIMMGAGQPVSHLWSRKLQELLGGGYCVFNLAGPTGALNGFAGTTLGILGPKYKRAYIVADMTETVVAYSPDGVMSQMHYFWGAYYRGMLDPAFVAHGLDANSHIRVAKSLMGPHDAARAEQLRLGAWLDSYLHFIDLWGYMHFRYFTTYYFPNANAFQWTARRTWPDHDFEPDYAAMRALKQFDSQPVGSPGFNHTLARLRDLRTYFTTTPQGLKLKENMLSLLDTQIRENIIDPATQNVVLAYIGPAPYYTDHLTGDERGAYETLYERKGEIFRRHGFHVVRPRLQAEDFSDLVHTNTLGGEKLAAVVAAQIEALEAAR